MDESKNESKTIVIVPTKIANISEYFPRFLLYFYPEKRREREKEKSGSIVHFFHQLYNLSRVGNALYISFLDKNQETLDSTTIPPFYSTRRRPFTAISIDKNLIDTTRYDKIS